MLRRLHVGAELSAAVRQIVVQLFHGPCAVADAVLHVGAQLGKGLACFLGREDGVVAKALRSALLRGDETFDDALEQVLLPFLY